MAGVKLCLNAFGIFFTESRIVACNSESSHLAIAGSCFLLILSLAALIDFISALYVLRPPSAVAFSAYPP